MGLEGEIPVCADGVALEGVENCEGEGGCGDEEDACVDQESASALWVEYAQVEETHAEFSHGGASGVEKEVYEGKLEVHLGRRERDFCFVVASTVSGLSAGQAHRYHGGGPREDH